MRQVLENSFFQSVRIWMERNRYLTNIAEIKDRWFCNIFFKNDIPYLWCSNERRLRACFFKQLRVVFARLRVSFPAMLFHENLGGWRRKNTAPNSRCLLLESQEDLFFLLERHMWNIGKEACRFRASDNYNVLFCDCDLCLVFSHENELYLFSQDREFLTRCRQLFRSARINMHMEI